MRSKQKVIIVIPTYNEGQVIQSVIKEINLAGYKNIIVVDDGSSDSTFTLAKKAGATAVRHMFNRGKGAAAKTGIEAAQILGADIIVTMDGDGQHNPKDISTMIQYLNEGYDIVLGSRLMNQKGMPIIKVVANKLGNLFTWLIYGLLVNDSQSGFRAYSRNAFMRIRTNLNSYEYDSEVIREIAKNKLQYKEIPIEVRYTDYSMSKTHKQSLVNGIKTVYKLLLTAV